MAPDDDFELVEFRMDRGGDESSKVVGAEYLLRDSGVSGGLRQ